MASCVSWFGDESIHMPLVQLFSSSLLSTKAFCVTCIYFFLHISTGISPKQTKPYRAFYLLSIKHHGTLINIVPIEPLRWKD